MAFEFKLPDIGEGVVEAEIVAWHVAVGDTVEEDAALADVMTDKATVEVPSPVAGKVLELRGAVGDKVRVGSVLVVLDAPSAGLPPKAAAAPAPTVSQPASPAAGTARKPAEPVPAASRRSEAAAAPTPHAPGSRPLASPAVRRRALEQGVDLRQVRGTGPAGRVIDRDIADWLRRARHFPSSPLSVAADEVTEIQVTGVRGRIAERMQSAMRNIPHYSYVEECDVTQLEELRQHLNADGGSEAPKLTPLPFIVSALVVALRDFPDLNARFDAEARLLRRHSAVHVGIATDTERGLMVPVVRDAQRLDLWECAAQIARLSQAARDGSIRPGELSGSTITISSLGAMGGLATTPIINEPEVAILGVNKIAERPMVRRGMVAIRQMMNLSGSFDHRIVDGAVAARFVQRIVRLLENPGALFVEHRR